MKRHPAPFAVVFGRQVPAARPLGTLTGRPVFRWPVLVRDGSRAALPGATIADYCRNTTQRLDVIAHKAAEAADLVQREFPGPCVEIVVVGPRGGIAARRYRGWEGAIGAALFEPAPLTTKLLLAPVPRRASKPLERDIEARTTPLLPAIDLATGGYRLTQGTAHA